MKEVCLYTTNEALVTACLEGEVCAWEALLARYGGLLYSIALRSGLSPEDAADIFQTVCIILLEKLPTLREPGKLHGWLVTTAKRECWRLLRLRQAPLIGLADLPDQGENLEPPPGQEQLPEDQLLLLEQQHKVRAGLKTLGPRCQKLLWALYYAREPLSHQAIGRLLDVSSNSVGRLRARCLERLRRAMEDLNF